MIACHLGREFETQFGQGGINLICRLSRSAGRSNRRWFGCYRWRGAPGGDQEPYEQKGTDQTRIAPRSQLVQRFHVSSIPEAASDKRVRRGDSVTIERERLGQRSTAPEAAVKGAGMVPRVGIVNSKQAPPNNSESR